MSAANHTPARLAGHAATYDYGNGVCVKPRCACGWIGRAEPPKAARAAYRNHVEVARIRAAKATGIAAA